jgi:hypothetical protein
VGINPGNPYLGSKTENGFRTFGVAIPWFGKKRLRFIFGEASVVLTQ